VANREETVVLVNDVMKTRPLAQWLEALRGAGVPCSPIHTLDEALAHPQLEARQLVVRSEHPVLGELRNIGMPVRFNGEPRRARSAPPLLGEHTTEVLREAGLDEAEIRRLVEAGVLGLADDAGASS
jgi:formyl-CoA transferase